MLFFLEAVNVFVQGSKGAKTCYAFDRRYRNLSRYRLSRSTI